MKEVGGLPDNAWPSTICIIVFLISLTLIQRTTKSDMFGIDHVAISLIPAWLAERFIIFLRYMAIRFKAKPIGMMCAGD